VRPGPGLKVVVFFFVFSSQRKKSRTFPIPKKIGLRKHNACESEPQLFGVDVSLSVSQSTLQFNYVFKNL
jgi:hypothetical protein